MRDYPNILVAFLEPFEEGYEFTRWPHHITILPWFKADRTALASIESVVMAHLPIPIEIGQTDMFGARSDILVRLVESEALKKLHQALLHERDGLLGLVNSRFVGDEYRPHVTLSGTDDPSPGHRKLPSISLVTKIDTNGKAKRVNQNFVSGQK